MMSNNQWSHVDSTMIEFVNDNPHREGTAAHGKFNTIKSCVTVGEAKSHGSSAWDLAEYYKKGKLKVLEVVPMQGKGGAAGGDGGRVAVKGGGGGGKVKGEGKGKEGGKGEDGEGSAEGGGGGGKGQAQGVGGGFGKQVPVVSKSDVSMSPAGSCEVAITTAAEKADTSKHLRLEPGVAEKLAQVKMQLTPIKK